MVSTHSRSKAAAFSDTGARLFCHVSTHSRSKAAACLALMDTPKKQVSTHSRSKAAAGADWLSACRSLRFNSQPLEGGCVSILAQAQKQVEFQLTAARRRLLPAAGCQLVVLGVSTHSRSKAAAPRRPPSPLQRRCFNSQPLEGGCAHHLVRGRVFVVSTHSRSKAAAPRRLHHSRRCRFQLTAARRRLPKSE